MALLQRKISRARSTLWRCSEYMKCFGDFRGIALAFIGVLPYFRGRKVEVRIPGAACSVTVRLGTTDILVFNSIYRGEQYACEAIRQPRVIVDAGAYTGLSAVYYAIKYPEAKIIAIEPNDSNFELLLRNTARFGQVSAIHAALWPNSGSLLLADPGDGEWGFRVIEEQRQPVNEASSANMKITYTGVPAVSVPELMSLHQLDRIDLLKLDIEGSEKEIFSDSCLWLKHVRAICLELHDRFKPGCSRVFFRTIDDFPVEIWREETVTVMRDPAQLPGTLACYDRRARSAGQQPQLEFT